MNIGIDISQIVYEGTGVARFTRGLLRSIFDYDTKNHWRFFFSGFRRQLDRETTATIATKGHTLIKWPLPPKLLSVVWNDWHLNNLLPKQFEGLDLFITSDWTEPKIQSTKKATIVHDVAFKRYPETVEKNILETQNKRLKWVVRETDLIFADSLATKNDLIKYYNIDTSKITVNYPGVEIPIFNNRAKYTKPFILTVGKLEPRKNLERLVKAFNKMNDQSLDLVIVGPKGWQTLTSDFYRPNIKVYHSVSDNELWSLYAGCLFFVYPSLWEGFGIPVIEAMKSGVAVACSKTSSVGEIAGDAALTFDPTSTDSICRAMETLKKDQKLRHSLAVRGLKNAAKFTWKNYYDKMMTSIYQTVKGNG